MRPEPYIEEMRYQARLELEHKKYLKGCPWCCVCDEQIEEPNCYQLDESNIDTCLHESCYEKSITALRRSNIPYAVRETLEEMLSMGITHKITPHEEV